MLLIVPPNTENVAEISALVQTATCLDWTVCMAPISWRIPKEYLGQEGAVYGENYFCEIIADQMNWQLISNDPDWLTKLDEKDHVRRVITMSTLTDAQNLTVKKFIKPANEGDNLFPAAVYETGDKLPKYNTVGECPVLLSGTIPYNTEWRCFVKNRKVASVCCYRHMEAKSEHIWPFDGLVAIEFVNKVLADEKVPCAAACTIDVGRSKKGFMSVIESSPAYTSELYGCELVGALDVIKASCVRK